MASIANPVEVVVAWQEAVDARRIDDLLALSHPEIVLVGPRGIAWGHRLLHDWLARAGLSMETVGVVVCGNKVVVEQHGIWRSPDTGEIVGQSDIASHFVVWG